MRKIIFTLMLAVLLLAGIAGGAMAAGTGFGSGSHEICIREVLDNTQLQLFEEIIATYRVKMEDLRNRIAGLRGTGDREAIEEVFEERSKIKTERYEALVELLPEEYSERFSEQGRGGRYHGEDKSSEGFQGRHKHGAGR